MLLFFFFLREQDFFTLIPELIMFMRAHAFFFFLQLIGYANLCYASERSEVDPVNRQMTLRTHNVSTCFLFTF